MQRYALIIWATIRNRGDAYSRVSRWSDFGTYMVQKIIIDENCTKDHVKTLQRPCKDHYEVIVIQPIMFNFAAG